MEVGMRPEINPFSRLRTLREESVLDTVYEGTGGEHAVDDSPPIADLYPEVRNKLSLH